MPKKHPSEYKQIYKYLRLFKSFLSSDLYNYQQLLITQKWLKSAKKGLKKESHEFSSKLKTRKQKNTSKASFQTLNL